MDKINELREKLQETRPACWEQLPDIELYKDQVLSYMQRQFLPSENEEVLTGAMINNYIKAGALPRSNGKKYGREHLAYLTAICALKPAMSVSDIEYLLKKQSFGLEAKNFYELICTKIDKGLTDTAGMLNEQLTEDELPEYILTIALQATGLRIVCEKLLKVMRDNDPEISKDKKAQNGAKKDKKEDKDEKK